MFGPEHVSDPNFEMIWLILESSFIAGRGTSEFHCSLSTAVSCLLDAPITTSDQS